MTMQSLTPMPPEIASAITTVMRAFGRLVKDGKNQHGGYTYASTDAFFEVANPACAEAGLIIKPRALAIEIETHDVSDRNTKQVVAKRMVHATYSFVLIHESGAMWCDDLDKRVVMLDYTGPQSLGAAESYAAKTYMRSLFLVATGDKDADAQEQHHAEVIRATVKAVKQKKETGEAQVLMDFGNGLEPIAAADVADLVLAHLDTFETATAAAAWWDGNKHGREEFHNAHPRLALDLKRKVEAALAGLQEKAA